MARNVEIKARIREPDQFRERVEELSDTPVEILDQQDTFFHVRRGRIKLRVFSDGRGELIAYQRPDAPGPVVSDYHLVRTENPEGLKSFLDELLGVRGVVRKRRRLYRTGQTRIHLDYVEDLGAFLELEVVLGEDQSKDDGARIAGQILADLWIPEADRVDSAYIDLLEDSDP